MRPLSLFTTVALLSSATGILAGEPTTMLVPAQPTLMWVSATSNGNGVSLRIQTIQYTTGVQEYKVTYPVKEKTWHKGKLVEHTRMVEQRQMRNVLLPAAGPLVEVPIDASNVHVFEASGNLLASSSVAHLLSRETAALVSTTGPVHPYYVQTSPPGTLIVQVPSNLLYPTAAIAQNSAPSPATELAPASASAPATVVNYNEPPLAPATPKKN